jgi:hypothetical protein
LLFLSPTTGAAAQQVHIIEAAEDPNQPIPRQQSLHPGRNQETYDHGLPDCFPIG